MLLKNFVYLLVILLFCAYNPAVASTKLVDEGQSEEADSDSSRWDTGAWFTLNGSQASYRNWAQGGVNNVTGIGTARFTAEYRHQRYIYNHSTNLRYGQSRINGNEFRKTDDEIRVRNQIRRLLDDERFSLIAQFNFTSQFDIGKDRNNDIVVSKFMAPGYFIETVGFAYNPEASYQIDLGISMRQTVVLDTTLSTRYGLNPGEQVRNEAGISFGVKAEREIFTNVVYSGQLETFSNLLEPLSSTTVRFNNELIGKINDYLTANVGLSFLYDDNVTKELQIRQILSIGFSYRLL